MATNTDSETLRAAAFLDKGGVGKTTATAHIGVCAARAGYKTLLIDLAGKQNDLAKHFGLYDDLPEADERFPNISTTFDEDWAALEQQLPDAVEGMIRDTGEGPDLIPAHRGLDAVDDELASVPIEERVRRLDSFLTDSIDPLGYDLILLDLPGLANNVTYNGLVATNNVYTPVELGAFEERQLDALQADLDELEAGLDTHVEYVMVIPNRVDTQTKVGTQVLDSISETYADRIAPAGIPESQDFKNAQYAGQTIFALESPLATGERARAAYEESTLELLRRLKGGASA